MYDEKITGKDYFGSNTIKDYKVVRTKHRINAEKFQVTKDLIEDYIRDSLEMNLLKIGPFFSSAYLLVYERAQLLTWDPFL